MAHSLTRRVRGPLAAAVALALVVFAVVFVASAADRGAPPVPAAAPFASVEDRATAEAEAAVRRDPTNARAQAALTDVYVLRFRETGDPAWYTRAEQAGRAALAADPRNPEALDAVGGLALSRHRFAEALALARRSRAAAPGRVAPLGVEGDALIELGRYREGFAVVQERLELRPDLASYSRASYVAELEGRRRDAIRLMALAVDSARPGTESRAWTRVQLGLLLFGQGDLAGADRQMATALAERPDDPRALAGRARILAARGRTAQAATLYSQALDRQPSPEYAVALAEIARLRGDEAAYRDAVALVDAMHELLASAGSDVDLDVALTNAELRTPTAADIARARAAHTRRPGVIGDQVLGWVLTRAGRCVEGARYARRSLRLGTRDATLLFQAGMAALCVGDRTAARTRLSRALALNPHFSPRWAPVARRALKGL